MEDFGGNCKLRVKYATVKIPAELTARLDECVSYLGHRSRAEMVNDAIRRFIDERRRRQSIGSQCVGRKDAKSQTEWTDKIGSVVLALFSYSIGWDRRNNFTRTQKPLADFDPASFGIRATFTWRKDLLASFCIFKNDSLVGTTRNIVKVWKLGIPVVRDSWVEYPFSRRFSRTSVFLSCSGSICKCSVYSRLSTVLSFTQLHCFWLFDRR